MATPFRPPISQFLRLSLVLVAMAIAGTIGALPAGAVVTTVGSTEVGLQPRSTTLYTPSEEPYVFANSSGNPVLSANKTYAIYWDPTDHYHGDWQGQIDKFFHDMGAASGSFASVYAVDAQYTDAANQHALYKSTFMGAYTDTDPYPASACEDPEPLETPDLIGPEVKKHHTSVCLDDTQIQEELGQFITQHSLQKGMGTIFYLMTPPGVTVCLGSGGSSGQCSDYRKASYTLGETQLEKEAKEEEERLASEKSVCSYHSDISPTSPMLGDVNTVLYGVIPWIAGGMGDGFLTPHDKDEQGFECQDGGWDPSGKKPEKREKKKERNKEEEVKAAEEFSEMNKEEQENQLEKEFLEGPHQQEPNQQPCPTPDGYCDTGLADLIINQIGVEQQNIVTDPLLNAWQDPKHNEATDECRNFFASAAMSGGATANEETGAGTLSNQLFAGGMYYLNDAFNLAALKLPYPAIPCLPGIRLEPQFTVPNTVNANEIVGFDGMESDITLNAGTSFTPSDEAKTDYATYTWSFGDGSAPVTGAAPGAPQADSPAVSPCPSWELPCAASTYHTYQYGGTYEVTFTVTDVGGNTVSVTEPVKVEGPPAPAPEQPSSGGSGGGSGAPASTTTGGSSSSTGPSGSPSPGATPTIPAPVVTGIATTTSLKKALSKGLPVHYTANEQVAGSIEVLLESSVAKRLGVHGSTATGLPKGTPSSIVVGTAVLVTTKAGQGTLHIKFSSRTSARLKHVRKLKLMLRLFARNASRQSPQTTTALSTVVLNP